MNSVIGFDPLAFARKLRVNVDALPDDVKRAVVAAGLSGHWEIGEPIQCPAGAHTHTNIKNVIMCARACGRFKLDRICYRGALGFEMPLSEMTVEQLKHLRNRYDGFAMERKARMEGWEDESEDLFLWLDVVAEIASRQEVVI